MITYRVTAQDIRDWLLGAEQAELMTPPLDLPDDQSLAYYAGYRYAMEIVVEPWILTGEKPELVGFLGTPWGMNDARRMARDNELHDVPAMKLATDFIADRIAAYEAAL